MRTHCDGDIVVTAYFNSLVKQKGGRGFIRYIHSVVQDLLLTCRETECILIISKTFKIFQNQCVRSSDT